MVLVVVCTRTQIFLYLLLRKQFAICLERRLNYLVCSINNWTKESFINASLSYRGLSTMENYYGNYTHETETRKKMRRGKFFLLPHSLTFGKMSDRRGNLCAPPKSESSSIGGQNSVVQLVVVCTRVQRHHPTLFSSRRRAIKCNYATSKFRRGVHENGIIIVIISRTHVPTYK